MFRHRWRLSETEKREYRVIGEELNAAGAMLDLSSFRTPTTSMLRLQQVGEAYARTYDRGSVYVVHVSILCLASLLILDEFTVGSSDWNLGAYMVDDPIIASPSNLLYRMMDGTTFHRNEVL